MEKKENTVNIDAKTFFERIHSLIDLWKASVRGEAEEDFQNVDAIAVCLGKTDDSKAYSKTAIIQNWLLGFEFSETLFVITKEKFVILTSPKKAGILQALQKEESKVIKVEIVVKNKDDANEGLFQKVAEIIKDSMAGQRLGIFKKDSYEGKLFEDWTKFSKSAYETVDVAAGIAGALAVKDEAALNNIRLASDITSFLLRRYVVEKMEIIIDEGKKITHSAFSDEIDNFLMEPKSLKKIKAPPEAKADMVDWAYTPIIQSGGSYDLRPSAASNEDVLKFDIILCSLGTRYSSYCSNISRTFLISPTPEQEENYNLLLEVQQAVIDSLREGIPLKRVYETATRVINAKKPALLEKFTKNVGFGIGLEFRESAYSIGPKSEHEVRTGMVFNVVVGFQDLEVPGKPKKYALLLADVVEITNTGSRILTEYTRKLEDISYSLEEGDQANPTVDEPEKKKEKSNDKGKQKESVEPVVKKDSKKSGVLKEGRTRGEEHVSKEQERREKQRELFKERQDEAMKRYSNSKGKNAVSQSSSKKIESYKKASDLPVDVSPNAIFVDMKRESVILPIFGFAVPFHISMIKNPSLSDGYLRLNFVTPGQAGKDQINFPLETDISFIREVTFKSANTKLLEEASKQIKELKKIAQDRETKRKELEDLVEQADLISMKGGATLHDVLIRPALETKRIPGMVTVHKNGIRYQSNTGKKVDVLFSNIKHLIFQPCEKEVIVLIHVHLKHPIMFDKKKTKDIQFYRDVVDSAVDEVGSRKRTNLMDRDEIGAEEEERRHRKKQNREFKAFAKEIADKSDGFVELDEPFRDLGFHGVPFRSNVFLQPTAHALVHLSEPPFFVVTMEDIELVHFERIEHGLKNFDMVFIFKDYKRAPIHTNTISMQQFENIKDWLDESDVPYTEGKTNLNWSAIMKHINEDPQEFFNEGGWSFLLPDSDDENKEEESDSGSEFEVSSSEDDDYESSEVTEDSEVDSFEEDSDIQTPDEDSGDDWSDLEEKAAASDKKRAAENPEEEEDRPKKKRK